LIVYGCGLAPGFSQANSRAKTPPPSSAPKAFARQSGPEVALLARGAKLHREGKVEEAESVFKEVLAHNPQNVDAFFDLGAIAEGRGDLFAALSNYRAALALRPGDKELKDAVLSTEKAIRRSAVTTHQENQTNSGMNGGNAVPFNDSSHPLKMGQAKNISDLQSSNIVPSVFSPSFGSVDSALSVPMADAEPKALDTKTFQLSSRKGEFVPPTLGITPDQFPDLPVGLGGHSTTNICPPATPPTLTVNQNQTSTGGQKMRRAAGFLLTVGAGAALNMSGLHCPICHMLNSPHP